TLSLWKLLNRSASLSKLSRATLITITISLNASSLEINEVDEIIGRNHLNGVCTLSSILIRLSILETLLKRSSLLILKLNPSLVNANTLLTAVQERIKLDNIIALRAGLTEKCLNLIRTKGHNQPLSFCIICMIYLLYLLVLRLATQFCDLCL